MTKEEFKQVVDTLKGAYKWMFDTEEKVLSWYSFLRDYPYGEVKMGVTRYVLNYKDEPTIADILDSTAAARRENRVRTNMRVKSVKCIYCQDTGLIISESPTGVMLGRPCTKCDRGRQNYPWDFLDDKERADYYDRELRRGRMAQPPSTADKDFYMAYVFGRTK